MKAEVPALRQLCHTQIGACRDSQERKKGGQGASVWWLLVLILSLLQACTLEHEQYFHVAGSSLSLLALGGRGAKNNQAGISTCGTFTVVAFGRLACLLQAQCLCCPCSYFLWPPFLSLPQAMAPSLLLFFLE